MQINLHKLISQLSKSKRQVERKIGNTMMRERQHLMATLGRLSDHIPKRSASKRNPSEVQH